MTVSQTLIINADMKPAVRREGGVGVPFFVVAYFVLFWLVQILY